MGTRGMPKPYTIVSTAATTVYTLWTTESQSVVVSAESTLVGTPRISTMRQSKTFAH